MKKRNSFYNKKTYEEKVNKDNKLILQDYQMEMKSVGKKEGTIYQYSADIKMFFCWIHDNLDNMCILDLKKRQFRTFYLQLQESGVSASRINRVQCSLRTLLEFVFQDDDGEYDYDANVMQTIKGLEKNPEREIVFLSDEQVTTIIDTLLEEGKTQQALYMSLSYDSAGRRNEIHQVEKHSFYNDEEKQTNPLLAKRGKKYRALYMDRTKKIAKQYLEERGEDEVDSLWVSTDGEKRPLKPETLYYWVTTFRKILGEEIGEFNPHSIRHSSLENYENGTHYNLKQLGVEKLPIEVLKVLANHTSIETTQSYLKDKDEEILNEAFKL